METPEIRWLVCHTRPRCEKKFAALLTAADIEHYLPLLTSRKKYASGEKTHTKPLFPGYVFAHVPVAGQKKIYEQQLIARTITVRDETQFLRQLEQVRLVVSSGLAVSMQPLFDKGREVRITAGPLRGVIGVVFDNSNPENIVIKMDVLQQGVLVKISPDALQPA